MLVGGAGGCGRGRGSTERLLSAQGERGPDNLSGDRAGGFVIKHNGITHHSQSHSSLRCLKIEMTACVLSASPKNIEFFSTFSSLLIGGYTWLAKKQ